MHDPMTVAHEIRYPWRADPKSKHFPEYRRPFITIWHVDPETDGSDDSCGWFAPRPTAEQRAAIEKLGRDQYKTVFSRRHYIERGESFASAGFEPSTYEAVYWAWRAIKALGRDGWQYGKRLSRGEEEEVRLLASNPVDNVQWAVANVQSPESCAEFFAIVHRAFLRYHRHWWQHPRWHLHHWKIQVVALLNFKRWAFTRCLKCGGRFAWGESGMGTWDGGGPRWFRSETLTHMSCASVGAASSVRPPGEVTNG